VRNMEVNDDFHIRTKRSLWVNWGRGWGGGGAFGKKKVRKSLRAQEKPGSKRDGCQSGQPNAYPTEMLNKDVHELNRGGPVRYLNKDHGGDLERLKNEPG